MTKQPSLLKAFESTGVSYTVAAREIGMARTTLHGVLHGAKHFDARRQQPVIRAWIKNRAARTAFRAKPLIRFFARNNIPVLEAAAELGLSAVKLHAALSSGDWESETDYRRVQDYLEQRKERGQKKMITKKSLGEEVLRDFRLDRDPFTDEIVSEEDLKETKQTRQALAKMQGAVSKHGWFALTGPKGSGKTQIAKRFRAWLKARKATVVVEPNTVEGQYLGPSGLCDAIMRGLGAEYNEHSRLEQRGYQLRLAVQAAQASGTKIVVLIDEAHLLRDDTLLALKRLYELDRQFGKPIAFILVGQEKLASRLKSNIDLSEVAQRVDLFELGGLNGELGGYLEHKLERAGLNGASAEIFDKSALKEMSARLKQVTGDTPLAANNLAAAALIVAHELGEKRVTAETIRNIPMSF